MSRDEGRKGRRLSDDETKLWRGVIKSVAPLRKRQAAKPKDDDHPPVAAQKSAPRKSVFHSAPAAPIVKPKPPAAPPLAPIDRRLKHRLAGVDHHERSAVLPDVERQGLSEKIDARTGGRGRAGKRGFR